MELNINAVSNKEYQFRWDAPIEATTVKVTIPDLTNLSHSVWGDWGPMHTFELNEYEAIVIKYNDISFDSVQKSLQINSPMTTEEREQNPFYLVIEDQSRNLKFHLYLNKEYELAKVEVIRTRDSVKLYETQEENYLQQVI